MPFITFSFLVTLAFLSCQTIQKTENSNFYYTHEKTEQERWQEVLIQIEKQDFKRAFTILQNLKHKNNSNNLKILGYYYEKIQEYSKALEFYKLSYNVQKNLEVGISIAKLLVMLGELENAIHFLENMKQDLGENFEISFQLGILYKQNQPETAEKIFEKLLVTSIENEQVNLQYLDSLLLQGKYKEASLHLQSIKHLGFSKNLLSFWELQFYLEKAKNSILKNDLNSTLQALSITTAVATENEEISYELVNLLCKLKEFSKAEKLITEMKNLEWKFLALGIYFFYKNDLEQSLEYFQQGYLTYPWNVEYLKQLGNLFFYLGDLKKAKFYFYEGKAKNPKAPHFSFQLGLIAIEENLLELAEKEFLTAHNLGYKEAKFFLDTLKIFKTQEESEILILEKNLQIESEWKKTIYYLLGNFFFQKKNFKKSKHYYNEILKEDLNSFFAALKLYEIAQLEKNSRLVSFYESQVLNLIQNDLDKKKLFLSIKERFSLSSSKLKISKSFLRFSSAQEIIQIYLTDSQKSNLTEILTYLEEIGEKNKLLEILKLLSQTNPEVQELLGLYYWKLGDKLHAQEVFETLRKLNNNFFIEYNLGFIHLSSNPNKAIEHFLNSLNINSEYYYTYIGLGKAYFYLNNYEMSKQYFLLSLEKFGERELTLWNLGILELKFENINLSKKIFFRMKKIFNSSGSFYGLSLVYEKEGKKRLSKKYLLKAIQKEEKLEYFEKLVQILKQENSLELEKYKTILKNKLPNSHLVKSLNLEEKGVAYYTTNLGFNLNEIQAFQISKDSIFLVKSKQVLCMDRANSFLKWSFETSDTINKIHLFFSGILVYTNSNTIFFLDFFSGEVFWKRKLFISKLEAIDGYMSIFLLATLETEARKLYKLNSSGNILLDVNLEDDESFFLDKNENIYFLNFQTNKTKLLSLNSIFKKEKQKEWNTKEVQVLAKGKEGLYFKIENNIELIAKDFSKNVGEIYGQGEFFEFQDKLFCFTKGSFFLVEKNFQEVEDQNLLQKLRLSYCKSKDCFQPFLSKNAFSKGELLFLEFNLK